MAEWLTAYTSVLVVISITLNLYFSVDPTLIILVKKGKHGGC